jgi:hypothetical protein
MNKSKFERFMLQLLNNDVSMSWDLLDETGSHIVEEVVEDEDQGPSKEWGPYGWYHHPTKEQIALASTGKSEF